MINLTVVEDNVTITVSEVGPTGPAGQGVPTGGTAGQVLTKLSGTNYDTAWTTNGAGTVTSVGITESSAALNITGSPVTSSGNINIGFSGTSAQYVAGDGSLVTFPTSFDEAKRLVTQVTNRSGATMSKGTIVYINGAQGNLPTIAKAIANADATSAQTFGFLQTDIANNASGFVVIAGKLENLDTTAVAEGAQLYLSSTIAGTYTTTKQYAPNHLVYVGVVVRSHPTQGSIEVKIQNGYELDELHNVSAQTPSNNDGLFYNSSTQLWENKSVTSVLGVTPIGLTSLSGVAPVAYNNTNGQISMAAGNGSVPGYITTTDWNTFNSKVAPTTNVATNAPLQGGGNLSANRTISITQADTSTDGYLSSTDWNTFNNKVDSSREVTATSPLIGGGNLSSNITIGITAASSLTDGYITASDYVDFKNGIKQLGSQTVGYFTKYSGDKAIAQSSVYEDGTTLFLPAIVKQDGLGNSKAVVTDGSGNTVSATIGTGLSLVGGVLTATGTGTGSIGGTGTINYVPKFSGTSSIGNSNIQDSGSLITLGSDTYISSGALGIGTFGLTSYNLRITSTITGATSAYGIYNSSVIQSDVITSAIYNRTVSSTQAASFSLSNIYHYFISQGTFGSGSTVNAQYGFYVDSSLIGATANYGFRGAIASGTNRWNLYMDGTANNYMGGSLGIGQTSLTNRNLSVSKNITGGTTSYGIVSDGTIQSDVTSSGVYYLSSANTTAASFTLSNLYHYLASQSTIGAGSSVTSQYGYNVSANLIGATNNYGFFGSIPAGIGRWNLFMTGTADNFLSGNTGIGVSSGFVSSGPILTTTFTNGGSGYVDGTYTDVASSNISASNFADYALFTIVVSGGIVTTATLTWGAANYKVGDTLTVSNTLLGGTGSGLIITVDTVDFSQLSIVGANGGDITLLRNDSSLAAGENIGTIKWSGRDSSLKASGIYAEIGAFAAGALGGAYLSFFTRSASTGTSLVEAMRIDSRGGVGIGATTLTGYTLRVSKNITGAVSSFGIANDGVIQSDVTTGVQLYRSAPSTQATTFTLGSLTHFYSREGTIGAGSSITVQYGFVAESNLTSATTNYGFFGAIPAGTNRWNLYMAGTAANYMAGVLNIGTTTLSGFTLDVNGTARVSGALTLSSIIASANPFSITNANGAGDINFVIGTNTFFNIRNTGATLSLGNFTLNTPITGSATNSSRVVISSTFTGTQTTGSLNLYSASPNVTSFTHSSGALLVGYNFGLASAPSGGGSTYAFRSSLNSGNNAFNLYIEGTAQNYLNGNTGLGTLPTTTAELSLGAGTTAQAQINLASSTAPTSPVNGDIWFDGTSLKIRIGGVTRTVTVT